MIDRPKRYDPLRRSVDLIGLTMVQARHAVSKAHRALGKQSKAYSAGQPRPGDGSGHEGRQEALGGSEDRDHAQQGQEATPTPVTARGGALWAAAALARLPFHRAAPE